MTEKGRKIFTCFGIGSKQLRREDKMNQENLIKFAAATNNDIYDPEYNGGEWMVKAVETHETIEQFIESSEKWKESGAMKAGEIAGFKFVFWPNVQTAAGQQRRDVSVIDFGDIRIVLNDDITNFI